MAIFSPIPNCMCMEGGGGGEGGGGNSLSGLYWFLQPKVYGL